MVPKKISHTNPLENTENSPHNQTSILVKTKQYETSNKYNQNPLFPIYLEGKRNQENQESGLHEIIHKNRNIDPIFNKAKKRRSFKGNKQKVEENFSVVLWMLFMLLKTGKLPLH